MGKILWREGDKLGRIVNPCFRDLSRISIDTIPVSDEHVIAMRFILFKRWLKIPMISYSNCRPFVFLVRVNFFHEDSAEYLYSKANSSSTFKSNVPFKHIGLCISTHSQLLQSYHSNPH